MKVQRKTFWTLTVISIISWMLLIIVYLVKINFIAENVVDLIKTIISGIFTGAIVTLITTLLLYYSEKKKYMERIIQYSRIYYQCIQNCIQDCKSALTSYNIEDMNTISMFMQNIDSIIVRLNNANTYIASQNMIYKEEYKPIFIKNKKNINIGKNINILTSIYLKLSAFERDLSLEKAVRKSDYISLFYYIRNLKEQLKNERNILNQAVYEIDKNYNYTVKWTSIIKEIDDFINGYNDLIIDKTINVKSEKIANSANIKKTVSSIEDFTKESPEQVKLLKQFGNMIENQIKNNENQENK